MGLSWFEVLVIIFVSSLLGITLAQATGIKDILEEKMAKRYRERYFLRKLHNMLLSNKKEVPYVFDKCFSDIRYHYGISKLIALSFEDKTLIAKRNEIIEGCKYALALAFSGVLSEDRAKETIEHIFFNLCGLSKAETENLPSDWYEDINFCVSDYVLLDAFNYYGKANFLFKKKSNGQRISIYGVEHEDIYKIIKQLKEGNLSQYSIPADMPI